MLGVHLEDGLGLGRILAGLLQHAREVAADVALVDHQAGRRIHQARGDAHILGAILQRFLEALEDGLEGFDLLDQGRGDACSGQGLVAIAGPQGVADEVGDVIVHGPRGPDLGLGLAVDAAQEDHGVHAPVLGRILVQHLAQGRLTCGAGRRDGEGGWGVDQPHLRTADGGGGAAGRGLALLGCFLHPLRQTVLLFLKGGAHLGGQAGRRRTVLDHRHYLDRFRRADQQGDAPAQDGEHRKGQKRQPKAHGLGVGDIFAAGDQQGAFHWTASGRTAG